MALDNNATGNGIMGALGGMATGAAGSIAGGAINSIFNAISIGRQEQAQRNLIDYATDKNTEAQMEMWNRTNYAAQVKQMMQAGLNPALMYKSGAQGGATTGSGAMTGGNVTSDIKTDGGGIGMMALQGAMLEAQIKNINADTEQKLTQANVNKEQPNVQQSQTELNTANATLANAQSELTKANTQLQQIETNFQTQTYNTRVEQFGNTAETIAQQLNIIKNNSQISDETKETQIKQQIANLAETWTQIRAQETGINLTQKQIWQIGQTVAQNWNYVQQGATNTEVNKQTQMNQTQQGWQRVNNEIRKTGIEQSAVDRLWDINSSQKFKNYTSGISDILNTAAKGAAIAL